MKIAVVSDTHNLLREEAIERLKGTDLIIHGGDVCNEEILSSLNKIAPVRAVRGNNDAGSFGGSLPIDELLELEGKLVYIVHDINDMRINPEDIEVNAVVFGHSHKPMCEKRGEVLYLNPGSIGRRRFKLPITMAYLYIEEGELSGEIINLEDI